MTRCLLYTCSILVLIGCGDSDAGIDAGEDAARQLDGSRDATGDSFTPDAGEDVGVPPDAAGADSGPSDFEPTPAVGPIADIPDDFDREAYLTSTEPTDSSADEPSGNFRMFCSFANLGYNDPIVYPGQEGRSHLHMFFGNTNVTHVSNYETLRTTGGSTCQGGDETAGVNRTGYWMPALIDYTDEDNPEVIVPVFFLVYYKGSGTAEQIGDIPDYPNGLRMIAGHGSETQPDYHRWLCDTGPQHEGPTIPTDCDEGSNIVAAIPFPTCWDGVNLDSPDHRSHVRYRENNPETGQADCPASHPVRIPELTEFAHFPPNGSEENWRLSSDDGLRVTNGGSFHADWYGAWSNAVQTRWRENCINGLLNCDAGDLGDGERLASEPMYMGPMRLPVPPAP